MWKTEYSFDAETTEQIVWDIWQDVPNWKTWDHALELSHITGPFTAGTHGQLQPKDGPLFDFELISVHPPKSFVDETKLPVGSIRIEHELTPLDSKVRITHRVIITGPMAGKLGPQIAQDIPDSVDNLAKLAEQKYANGQS